MKAVFRHEMSTHFTTMGGYVFGTFLLLFAGVYTMVYNIKSSYAAFEYVMDGMTFVFIVIVPILTMKVLAEEKRQKTDHLLYSLPLSMAEVILGKFIAMLCIFLLPLVIIGIYPLILSRFGNVYLPAAYGSMVGFFLLGASLIAIGMFISSVTESQAVAAGLCFVVMLLNYFLSSLAGYMATSATATLIAFTVIVIVVAVIVRFMTKNNFASLMTGLVLEIILVIFYITKKSDFESLFSGLMEKFSLFDRFYRFTEGIFDITGIVYFISIIGIFLFLSVQSLEKRRWSE